MVGAIYDPRPLIHCCDLLLVPSHREPWGRTAVEAMLLERPVIGAAAGGLVEIIDHEQTGLLYPPGDTAALAQAISRLLRDASLRAQLVQTAKRSATERYGLEAYAGAVQTALEQACRAGNPATATIRFAAAVGNACAQTAPIWSVLKHRASPLRLLGAIKRRLRQARSGLRSSNRG
jgi:hypothetical protein